LREEARDMNDIDTEQHLEGGMYVQMWLSHAEEVRPQVELQEMIWDELRCEPESDTANVSVEVEDFVATLSGWVPSYPAKLRAQRAAERVAGVVEVINDIAVKA
jgi:osmotically-inducible protein OsmY